MSPFQPAGSEARWVTIYNHVTNMTTGDVVTYEDLGRLLDLHPEDDRHAMQMAVRRAAKESLLQDKRALEAIPNKGYRIVEPEEHLRLAKVQQKKSRRALVRGEQTATNVDFNGMDPEVRHAFEVVAQAFAMQQEFMRRMDVRQKRIEQAVAEVRNTKAEASDVEALQSRLDRLENLVENSDHAKRIVDGAPGLTAEQREQLRFLLTQDQGNGDGDDG